MFHVRYIEDDEYSESCLPWRCSTKKKPAPKYNRSRAWPKEGTNTALLPGGLPKPVNQAPYKRKKAKPRSGSQGCSPCSPKGPGFLQGCLNRLPGLRKKDRGNGTVSRSFRYRRPEENGTWDRPQLYAGEIRVLPAVVDTAPRKKAPPDTKPKLTDWTIRRAWKDEPTTPTFLPAPPLPPLPKMKAVYISEMFLPPRGKNYIEIDIYGESEEVMRRRAEARNAFLVRKVPGSRSFFDPFEYKFRIPTWDRMRMKRKTRAFLLSAVVTQPSGRKAYPKIEDNKDGTVTIRYNPTETGLHELAINYNNQPIQGKWK